MFQAPRGTNDILPEDWPYWRHVMATAERMASLYGFERIDVPIFEATDLFERGMGEGAGVMVDKEMYTFSDKGGVSLTLRPEFTAGLMRSYLEHGMKVRPMPVKLYTIGPIFRQERPQAGRFRQHTQWNVEVVGEIDPAVDFEVMSIAWNLFSELAFATWPSRSTRSAAPRGLPACAPESPGRVFLGLSRQAQRSRPAAAGGQPPAPARTPKKRLAKRFRTARRAARIISATNAGSTFKPCSATWTPPAWPMASTRAWCAASTTTPRRCSRYGPRASARRPGLRRRPL